MSESNINITGAYIDNEYRDYPFGGQFTNCGEIFDNDKDGHPIFTNTGKEIQLEVNGELYIPATADEYICMFSRESSTFGF